MSAELEVVPGLDVIGVLETKLDATVVERAGATDVEPLWRLEDTLGTTAAVDEGRYVPVRPASEKVGKELEAICELKVMGVGDSVVSF